MDLSNLLQLTIDKKASDLHMVPGYFPTIRVNGEIFQLTTLKIVTPENLEKMLISILNQEQKAEPVKLSQNFSKSAQKRP